ncbi:ImmA/IrrE family metallo-endopeptidase [Streptococcus cristatus]|uniref:ImmA/IrrE family metallo-endopeptidase n=1 Tax=Streptococcus cristatus TaxID=45634 RepID=UPI001653280C|nr:ImmA/IrrE family metallo-endopeptidase [Streptococcus cristatus]MBC6976890.1 ImmA/IrrE family metallo-endopeptidase [Streptococcus cristatus]
MTEKELLNLHKVTLREFTSQQWQRNGFYDDINRIVYINADLSSDERRKVLFHELGHLEHYRNLYQNAPLLCENEANRYMIQKLVAEEVATYGVEDFNRVRFMERYQLKTTTDEIMIRDEFYKLVGGL